jgi:ribosomal protein S18 acetylase RimI-like enzyme
VVRPILPHEYDEAARVTVRAYAEFARNDEDWRAYEGELGDVAKRAQVARVLVAVEDERILGTVTLEIDRRIDPEDRPLAPDEAHVRMLGVDPAARGRGVGRALIEACMHEAGGAGKKILTLNTTKWMTAAQRMYESMGFRRGPDRVFDSGFVLLSYSVSLED